jgi:hypothetical protein
LQLLHYGLDAVFISRRLLDVEEIAVPEKLGHRPQVSKVFGVAAGWWQTLAFMF